MHKDDLAPSVNDLADVYFNNSQTLSRRFLGNVTVQYRYFARDKGLFFGRPFIEPLFRRLPEDAKHNLCVRSLPEGKPFQPKDVIMTVDGLFPLLVPLETTILGYLGHSGTARKMHDIVHAAAGRPVYDMSARHDDPGASSLIACAAKLAGAAGCSTKYGATCAENYPFGNKYFLSYPIGTTPHAVIAIMPMDRDTYVDVIQAPYAPIPFVSPREFPELRATELYMRAVPTRPGIVLNDFTGRELTVTRMACKIFAKDKFPSFWGVRCDTPGERYAEGAKAKDLVVADNPHTPNEEKWREGKGVTTELVGNIKKIFREEGRDDLKIMVSSGFGPEKTQFFTEENAPFDAVGTGSFIHRLTVTGDIVQVNGVVNVKAGRNWLALAPTNGLIPWEI